MKNQPGLYRELPSVDELLREPGITDLVVHDGQAAVERALDQLGDALDAVLAERLREGASR